VTEEALALDFRFLARRKRSTRQPQALPAVGSVSLEGR
jgi:hypothetical protein